MKGLWNEMEQECNQYVNYIIFNRSISMLLIVNVVYLKFSIHMKIDAFSINKIQEKLLKLIEEVSRNGPMKRRKLKLEKFLSSGAYSGKYYPSAIINYYLECGTRTLAFLLQPEVNTACENHFLRVDFILTKDGFKFWFLDNILGRLRELVCKIIHLMQLYRNFPEFFNSISLKTSSRAFFPDKFPFF